MDVIYRCPGNHDRFFIAEFKVKVGSCVRVKRDEAMWRNDVATWAALSEIRDKLREIGITASRVTIEFEDRDEENFQ